jgi:hypothetical protein
MRGLGWLREGTPAGDREQVEKQAQHRRPVKDNDVEQTVVDTRLGRNRIRSAHEWTIRNADHWGVGASTESLEFHCDRRLAELI